MAADPCPPPAAACDEDANGDGIADMGDLVTVILDWGCEDSPGPRPGDVNQGGACSRQDVAAVIFARGECDEPGPD